MKHNTFLLFKLLLMNQFKLNQWKEKNKKIKISTVLMGCAFLLLGSLLVFYSLFIGYGLGTMGIAWVIPSYALTIVGMITLFFTIFKCNGILFGIKDYESLMSLPVKTSEIIASRFLHMYLMNTCFSVLVMIPFGVSYYIFEKPSPAVSLIWIIGTLFSTLLPTALATIIGGLIAYISAHFKYTNALAILLSFLLIIGTILFSFGVGQTDESKMQMADLTKLSEMLSTKIHAAYPISQLFEEAVINNNIVAFLLFVAISLAVYFLFIRVFSYYYKKINTAMLSFQAKSNYKMKKLDVSSALKALYKKELKSFFSSYIYVLNIGMGVVMAFIMAIAVFVLEPATLEKSLEMTNLDKILTKVIAFAFSTILCMSCSTSVALSLEGKNLWILKSLPIPTKKILDSKILVNLTLTLPVSIVFGTLMNIKFETDIITRIFFYLIPIVYSLFIAIWGMFINTKLPNYEWVSETILIKQGAASMLGMLLGPVFAFVPIGAVLLFSKVPAQFIQAFFILLILVIMSILYSNITKYRL